MSGHKRTTITLSRDELRRLQEASRRLSEVENDFQKIQHEMSQLRESNFNESRRELETRQHLLDQSLAGVSSQLAAIEYSTSQAVMAQAASLQDEISRMGSDVWENTHALLNEHARMIENAFTDGQMERQVQFDHLRRSFNRIQHSEQEKYQYVEEVIQEAATLYESLHNLYANEDSAQAGLQESEKTIHQAFVHLQAGFNDAALVTAQQSFDNLSRLRLSVENHIQRRQITFQFAQEKLIEVENKLRENQKVRAVTPEGEPLETYIDTDFWSGGGWRVLARRTRLVREQLLNKKMPDCETSAALAESLAAVENELQHVVFNARLAVISSQVRFNIAEYVVSALQEQGYVLESSSYAYNDMRSPYEVQLHNFEGSEVMVHLSPHPSDPIAHDLDIAFRDPEQRSEHEMRQRAGELSAALYAFGLQMNGMRGVPEQTGGALSPALPAARRVQEAQERYGHH